MKQPIHKFITRPKQEVYEESSILWDFKESVYMPVKHSQTKIEVYAQNELIFKPREMKNVEFNVGFRLLKGVVQLSLKNEFKQKSLSLHDCLITEDVNKITVNIQNNSD